jgi:hypothetical protein
LVQITSDIELSGAGCTTAITPNQLVQSSSENDIAFRWRILNMANASRKTWLERGVPASDLDELETFAPVEEWDIVWESTLSEAEKRATPPEEQGLETGVFLTRVECPRCGTSVTYHLNAVTDFYHDDGEPCFDYQSDEEALVPRPGVW